MIGRDAYMEWVERFMTQPSWSRKVSCLCRTWLLGDSPLLLDIGDLRSFCRESREEGRRLLGIGVEVKKRPRRKCQYNKIPTATMPIRPINVHSNGIKNAGPVEGEGEENV